MSRTARERLIAGAQSGEFDGLTKAEIAKRIGVTERTARKIRASLGGPTNLVETSSKLADAIDALGGRWPAVQAFDAGHDDALAERIAHATTPEGQERARAVIGTADVVPSGHVIKGVSSFVKDGEIHGQWIKTRVDEQDNQAHVLNAIRNLAAEWPSIPDAEAPPSYADDDLLCVYPMGDPHIGMLACRPETGEEFNLSIAERNLFAAVDHLALLAPPASRAIIATVGDTFHSDGLSNTTTAGTRVDVDSRTFKMIDVGVRTFRRVIQRALLRHREVEVKIAPGNHDALISIMLRVALQQFFENEPRVHVDPSPEDFLWYRFGANLLGINHGYRAKADALMQAMAVDRAQDWGETRHRRMYTGHVHHETTKEVPGCTVDTLNTLASSDDWHRRQGYRSTRHMRMDIIHREFGLINRHIVGIEQIARRFAT